MVELKDRFTGARVLYGPLLENDAKMGFMNTLYATYPDYENEDRWEVTPLELQPASLESVQTTHRTLMAIAEL